ncbi:nuclear transport factor 2 family protein [Sphingobacterium sp. HJSM2_6]|uniref:nuclear transport factor 2 family protein n=1 Tax=Sphingobacterium sp. HJSM2_6 TaxID=3366264 RepID=UPI003BD1056A
MKTLATLIATALLTLISQFVKAEEKPEPVKFFKVENIIDHYLEATLHGNVELVDYLFTTDFYQSTPNNRSKESINKKSLIKYLKSLKGIKINCKSSYQFVEKNEDCSIVRIKTEFDTFERNDYVTICNGDDGWKISSVVVTYP